MKLRIKLRGYLQRNWEETPFMDSTSHLTKEKSINHKLNNERRREKTEEHL